MDEKSPAQLEAHTPATFSHFTQLLDQGCVNDDIINYHYKGAGTEDDPYIVGWIENDPRNPMRYSQFKKWSIVAVVAIATLAVSFISSAYSGSARPIQTEFEVEQEIVTLGVALFVLGFAIGPLMWAPCSELYGRQRLFFGTYMALTAFNAGAAGSKNITTLLILRFFAGAFGSSPLTNAGGVIADMFAAKQRGIAMSLFASAPFLGPTIGPIIGGFVGETIGWRWNQGIMAIFSGALWIIAGLYVPETYGPVLLQKRARRLEKITGKVYVSQMEADQGKTTAAHAFKTSLSRPWILLFQEPIVLMLSIYMAIIYGTLYMCFGAFPIVYQQNRGWSAGIGGLSFIGVMVGMMLGVVFAIWDNKRYIRAGDKAGGFAPPEARLPPCMVGGVAIPIGLFWFAWTNYPTIHWSVSIIATAPFGFGMVLVFLGVMNYLIDSYVIFAASVLAANSVLRSLFGFAFPLFTSQMYAALGIHWASSIPAFLALACAPFPFIFYKYGPSIRKRCKYAAQADDFLRRMREQNPSQPQMDKTNSADDSASLQSTSDSSPGREEAKRAEAGELETEQRRNSAELIEEREAEAFDYSYEEENDPESQAARGRFQRIKSAGAVSNANVNHIGANDAYEGNPFDLDRVNTHESFAYEKRSRSASRGAAGSRSSSKTRSLKSKKSGKSLRG